ncbi:hypothetical protein F5X68DRAFT_16952 [Plectosphaerella plurivora]|uniref:Phosphoglycerate mutase n=1 Tax=Plectosphaerella plurivora TaxID=936078 RepID=A0A9P8VA31_9PEZI|nr:hypothetical protein F5X68DRAFT_16952 [Plectosphaerella plurivora]
MTRTIQTAKLAFKEWIGTTPIQVWPDLRESHDGIFNHGVSRDAMATKFPEIDFSECPVEWDHPPHTFDGAVARAETVRQRLKTLADSERYQNIYLVSHRGFIAFLVQGERFNVCDLRTFKFASEKEVEGLRFGVNVDTETAQDFGPTVLISVDTLS